MSDSASYSFRKVSRKFLPAIIGTLLTSVICSAQSYRLGQRNTNLQVYQLNQEQFLKLHTYKNINDSLELFTNFIGTYPSKREHNSSEFLEELQYGHYLAITATTYAPEREINYRVYVKSFFKVLTKGYNNEVWVMPLDPEGELLTDAEVSINSISYPFRDDCGCYPIPVKEANGLICLKYNDHFEILTPVHIQSDSTSEITTPSIPFATANQQYKRNLPYQTARIYPGYVALNKPRYAILDTVKVKAFLVDEEGRPWQKKVSARIVTIVDSVRRNNHLYPYTPKTELDEIDLGEQVGNEQGVYLYNFRLHIKPGKYALEFRDEKNNLLNRTELSVDYSTQLKTLNTYQLNLAQKAFDKGDTVQIRLIAQDINGLSILKQKVRVSVYGAKIMDYQKATYALPSDWGYRTPLYDKQIEINADAAGVISIPDSIFPDIAAEYNIFATFYSPNGDTSVRRGTFTYMKPYFSINRKYDTLYVEHISSGEVEFSDPVELIATNNFYRYWTSKEPFESKHIQVPYKQKIDTTTGFKYYLLKVKNGQTVADFDAENRRFYDGPINIEGYKLDDTVKIVACTDRNLPISYQVFKNDQKVVGSRWKPTDPPVIYQAAYQSGDEYTVLYSAIWNKEQIFRTIHIYPEVHRLNVTVEQPETCQPGDTVSIKVKVTDYDGYPVKDVNLMAYAVNSLFGHLPKKPHWSFHLPVLKLPYLDEPRVPVKIHEFNAFYNGIDVRGTVAFEPKHIVQFNLRKFAFYGLLFAENGVGTYEYDIPTTWSELEINVNDRQGLVNAHAVYLNDVPVAIKGLSNQSGLKFVTPPGKYALKIRTDSSEYTIKKLILKKGVKTFLCLNVDLCQLNPNVSKKEIGQLPFTHDEFNALEPYFLYLKAPAKFSCPYLFDQDSFYINLGNPKTEYVRTIFIEDAVHYVMGPFKRGKIDAYNWKTGSQVSFRFKPGYTYAFNDEDELIKKKLKDPVNLSWVEHQAAIHQSYRFAPWFSQLTRNPFQHSIARRSKNDEKPALTPLQIRKSNFLALLKNGLRKDVPDLYGHYSKKVTSLRVENHLLQPIEWVLLLNKEDIDASFLWYQPYDQSDILDRKSGVYDIYAMLPDSSYFLIEDFELTGNGSYCIRIHADNICKKNQHVFEKYLELIDDNKYNFIAIKTSNHDPFSYIKRGQESSKTRKQAFGITDNAMQKIHLFRTGKYPIMTTIEPKLDLAVDHYKNLKNTERKLLEPLIHRDTAHQISSYYRDYGFWEPNLVTDSNGEAQFTVCLPDNITTWKTMVAAMTHANQSGTGAAYIRAIPSVSAHLELPKYMLTDDSLELAGKLINYTDSTVKLQTWFGHGNDTLANNIRLVKGISTEYASFSTVFPGKHQLSYGLQLPGGAINGEKSVIPIWKNETEIEINKSFFVKTDTCITITTDDSTNMLYVTDGAEDFYHKEIASIMEKFTEWDTIEPVPHNFHVYYRLKAHLYRLKALLLERKMAHDQRRPFLFEQELKTSSEMLRSCYAEDTTSWWGWSRSESQMTFRILSILHQLYLSGNEVFEYQHPEVEKMIQVLGKMFPAAKWETLDFLTSLNYSKEVASHVDDHNWDIKNCYTAIQNVLVKQRLGMPYSLEFILKTYQHEGQGIYWGNYNDHYGIWKDQWKTSAAAYQALKADGRYPGLMRQLRMYFLYHPSKDTARYHRLEGLDPYYRLELLDLIYEDAWKAGEITPATGKEVWLNGSKLDRLPYYHAFAGIEPICIESSGDSIHVSLHHKATKKAPEGNDAALLVNRWFEQFTEKTDTIRLQESFSMNVRIDVKEAMKYAQIKVPIPAASCYSEIQNFNRHETSRTPEESFVTIRCDDLPVGNHLFKVNFLPQFKGRSTAAPVVVKEQVYSQRINYSSTNSIVVVK